MECLLVLKFRSKCKSKDGSNIKYIGSGRDRGTRELINIYYFLFFFYIKCLFYIDAKKYFL